MTLLAVWVRLAHKAPSNQAMAQHAAMHSAAWPSCFTLASLFALPATPVRLVSLKRLTREGKVGASERTLCGVATESTLLLRKCSARPFGCPPRIRDHLEAACIARPSHDKLPRKIQRIQDAPLPPPSPTTSGTYCTVCFPHDGPKSFPRLSNFGLLTLPNAENAALSECMSALRCNACEPNMELVRARLAPIAELQCRCFRRLDGLSCI
ncbi:hypothetical protein V8C35DRAFT_313411 [Trichoderma chlorosporum]